MATLPMNTSEITQALTPLVEVLDRFGINYYMSGSMASPVHGKGQYTQDVDVVAALQFKHVRSLLLLQQAYYVDADIICDAIQNQSSFSLLHHDTGVKVDVCVQKSDPIAQQELRRIREEVLEAGSRLFFYASLPRYDSRHTRLGKARRRYFKSPVERDFGDDEGKAFLLKVEETRS